MQVLIAIPVFLPAREYGGPISKLEALRAGLLDAGVDLTIATSDYAGPGAGRFEAGGRTDNLSIDGWRILRMPTIAAPGWGPWVRWRAPDAPPDIVHVLGAWNGLSYSALRYAQYRKIPSVWEPAGMLTSRGRRARLKGWLRPYHQRWADAVSTVIWTSPQERKEAGITRPPEGSMRPNPAAKPPAELPSRGMARAALGLGEGTAVWGYLGRIAPRKGIERLLQAWGDIWSAASPIDGGRESGMARGPSTIQLTPVSPRGPDKRQPLFAGPAESTLLVQAIQRTPGATYIGSLDSAKRWTFLRAIDALTLVPQFGENFGNVVVEAVSVGTPAVVSEAVGCTAFLSSRHVCVANDEELGWRLREGVLPPPPDAIPAALSAMAVAKVQRGIYDAVLNNHQPA